MQRELFLDTMARSLFILALWFVGVHAFAPHTALAKNRLSSNAPAISALPPSFWTAGALALAEKTSDCECNIAHQHKGFQPISAKKGMPCISKRLEARR